MGNNNQNGIMVIFRVMGFIIALAALVYKIYFAILYYDKIAMWWNDSMIGLYFFLYVTSLATLASSFFKGKVGIIIAATLISFSFTLLLVDGVVWLGMAASLDSSSLLGRGIVPLVNALNILASVFNLIGSIERNSGNQRY